MITGFSVCNFKVLAAVLQADGDLIPFEPLNLFVEGEERQVEFGSQQMSDGVLRLLAVACLLYVERPPTLITFEEPENGAHPQP